ncbi:sensor histidine kinase [Actinomycetes bacterium NPDC127524]
MERWVILTKLMLAVFISVTCIRAETGRLSWAVLALLVYFCMNLALYLVSKKLRILLHALSIFLCILSYHAVQPVFIILLALPLIELAWIRFPKKLIVLFILLPLFYITKDIQLIYGFAAILCFMLYSLSVKLHETAVKYEAQLDSMRKDIGRLTKHVNENAAFIKQSEYTFKLEERNRISQEIHDKIGHSMTGALIQMEAAKRLIDADKKKAAELLQNAIHISSEGIEDIRKTLKNMKPPPEQMGIHQMKLLMDQFSAQNDIKAWLTYDGDLDIVTPIQWKVIFENVTEALTNVMKYSLATQVSCDIKVLNKVVRTEVRDNGIGAAKIKKGLGIIGMEERTAALSGKIIVDSTHGFSVTSLLPITSPPTV